MGAYGVSSASRKIQGFPVLAIGLPAPPNNVGGTSGGRARPAGSATTCSSRGWGLVLTDLGFFCRGGSGWVWDAGGLPRPAWPPTRARQASPPRSPAAPATTRHTPDSNKPRSVRGGQPEKVLFSELESPEKDSSEQRPVGFVQ